MNDAHAHRRTPPSQRIKQTTADRIPRRFAKQIQDRPKAAMLGIV